MANVILSKSEYKKLKAKADANEELLTKIAKGLDDIKNGRVKDWDEVKNSNCA